jgi:hypothetical protein
MKCKKRKMMSKLKLRRYRIRERVVFEYVWIVDAESPKAAKEWCAAHGDGEATEQNEGARKFLSVEEAPSAWKQGG